MSPCSHRVVCTFMSHKITVTAVLLACFMFFDAACVSAVVPVSRATRKCEYNVKIGIFEPPGCLPKPKRLPECSVCEAASSCSTGRCVDHRCLYKSKASKAKCIGPDKLPECAECWNSKQCESGKCHKGICWGRGATSAADCARKQNGVDLSSEVL